LPDGVTTGAGKSTGFASNNAGTPLDCAVMLSRDLSVLDSSLGCAPIALAANGSIKKKAVLI